MTPKAAIQKGKDLENYLADQLRVLGLDTRAARSHGSGNGNREKADIWTSAMILGQNAGFECKHCSTISLPEWWRQAKKLESLGREPILVIKHTNDRYEDTKAVIYLDTLLRLMRAADQDASSITAVPAENWEKKRAIANAVRANRELLKVFNQE